MDAGVKGNAGSLTLGYDASMSGSSNAHAFGTIDYVHRITETAVGDLSAFTHGFGGASFTNGRWRPEAGIAGGLELRW